eukprot:GAFH01002679.1.p6 GENE.GAFH01002679.1~~GAFH01002679.1.p6  ORF type:complete len:56 (-),score=12.42 GAFH01002679.1:609-776(-)
MARVEADSDSGLVGDLADDGCQLFEGSTQGATAMGRVFEDHGDSARGRVGMQLVD